MKDFLLSAAAGIDGDGPFKDRWYLLKGGVVVEKGSNSSPPTLPAGFPEVKLPFITPPLFDAHVHLSLSGSYEASERERVSSLNREEGLLRIMELLERYRSMGIMTLRDGGDPAGLALEASKVAEREPGRYAKVLPSARPLVMKGRYGGFLGEAVASLKEALGVVDENLLGGAAQIKVIATGINSLTRAGDCGDLLFFPDEVAGIISRCDQENVPVMVHLNGPLSRVFLSKHKLPASIEHGFYLEGEDIARLAASGSFWTPTLTAWSTLLEHPGLTEDKLEVVALTDVEHSFEVGEGVGAGCRLLAGSDAGTPGALHGEGLFAEANALIKCGAPIESIFSAAYAYLKGWTQNYRSPLGEGVSASFLGWNEPLSNELKPPDYIYSNSSWSSAPPATNASA